MWLFAFLGLCMLVLVLQTHSLRAFLVMGICTFLTWVFWRLA
jgi:hypothetical protein